MKKNCLNFLNPLKKYRPSESIFLVSYFSILNLFRRWADLSATIHVYDNFQRFKTERFMVETALHIWGMMNKQLLKDKDL